MVPVATHLRDYHPVAKELRERTSLHEVSRKTTAWLRRTRRGARAQVQPQGPSYELGTRLSADRRRIPAYGSASWNARAPLRLGDAAHRCAGISPWPHPWKEPAFVEIGACREDQTEETSTGSLSTTRSGVGRHRSPLRRVHSRRIVFRTRHPSGTVLRLLLP